MGIIPEMPETSNAGSYMKLVSGENKVRIMGPGIAGFEWWMLSYPWMRMVKGPKLRFS